MSTLQTQSPFVYNESKQVTPEQFSVAFDFQVERIQHLASLLLENNFEEEFTIKKESAPQRFTFFSAEMEVISNQIVANLKETQNENTPKKYLQNASRQNNEESNLSANDWEESGIPLEKSGNFNEKWFNPQIEKQKQHENSISRIAESPKGINEERNIIIKVDVGIETDDQSGKINEKKIHLKQISEIFKDQSHSLVEMFKKTKSDENLSEDYWRSSVLKMMNTMGNNHSNAKLEKLKQKIRNLKENNEKLVRQNQEFKMNESVLQETQKLSSKKIILDKKNFKSIKCEKCKVILFEKSKLESDLILKNQILEINLSHSLKSMRILENQIRKMQEEFLRVFKKVHFLSLNSKNSVYFSTQQSPYIKKQSEDLLTNINYLSDLKNQHESYQSFHKMNDEIEITKFDKNRRLANINEIYLPDDDLSNKLANLRIGDSYNTKKVSKEINLNSQSFQQSNSRIIEESEKHNFSNSYKPKSEKIQKVNKQFHKKRDLNIFRNLNNDKNKILKIETGETFGNYSNGEIESENYKMNPKNIEGIFFQHNDFKVEKKDTETYKKTEMKSVNLGENLLSQSLMIEEEMKSLKGNQNDAIDRKRFETFKATH